MIKLNQDASYVVTSMERFVAETNESSEQELHKQEDCIIKGEIIHENVVVGDLFNFDNQPVKCEVTIRAQLAADMLEDYEDVE